MIEKIFKSLREGFEGIVPMTSYIKVKVIVPYSKEIYDYLLHHTSSYEDVHVYDKEIIYEARVLPRNIKDVVENIIYLEKYHPSITTNITNYKVEDDEVIVESYTGTVTFPLINLPQIKYLAEFSKAKYYFK